MGAARLISAAALVCAAFAAPPPGAVEGRVLNRLTAEPLRKARVELRRVGARDAPRTAVTAADGKFVVRDLDPGAYDVAAVANGFLRATYRQTLQVAAGGRLDGIELRLKPQAVVAGRVVDEDGDPVEGTQVEALRTVWRSGRRTLNSEASQATDDRGEYRARSLPPGTYLFRAVYRLGESEHAPVYYPGTLDPAAAVPVDLVPGQSRQMDFVLLRARTFRVSGRARAEDVPPARIRVVLLQRLSGTSIPIWPSHRGPHGEFELRSVPPGTYTLIADAVESRRVLAIRREISVTDADLTGIELVAVPTLNVPGRIRTEGPGEVDFRKIWINAIGRDTDRVYRIEPGSDGALLFDMMAPDVYTLAIQGVPPPFYAQSARQGGRNLLTGGLDLTLDTSPVDIVLSAAGGNVTGTASPGQTVALVPADRARTHLYRNVVAGPQGEFAFDGVAPGDYKVFAWDEMDDGGWFDPAVLRQAEAGARSVTVRDNGRETVALRH